MMTPEIDPPYRIRKSGRSRRINLRFDHRSGQLEIVLPIDCSIDLVPDVLHRHRRWIAGQWLRFLDRTDENRQNGKIGIPEVITLHYTGELWQIRHNFLDCGFVELIAAEDKTIKLKGMTTNFRLCRKVFTRWLATKAQIELQTTIESFAALIKVRVEKIVFRLNKTRWGSMTGKGALSLSPLLLFLPKPLAHYIVIHELCHLHHLNHSPAFWLTVAKYDSEWASHRAELRRIEQKIAPWLIDSVR